MGKAKRRGNKKINKKAHKEKLQERRAEQSQEAGEKEDAEIVAAENDEIDGSDSDAGNGNNNRENCDGLIPYGGKPRPVFVGDGVWYSPGSHEYSPWFHYEIVEMSKDSELLTLQCTGMVQKNVQNEMYLKKDDIKERIRSVPVEDVFPDYYTTFSLRFKVDEKVICISPSGLWREAIVVETWPLAFLRRDENSGDYLKRDEVPLYRVAESDTDPWPSSSDWEGFSTLTSDADDCMMPFPESFRFKEGDEVVIDLFKVLNFVTVSKEDDIDAFRPLDRSVLRYVQESTRSTSTRWIDAKVSKVHILGEKLYAFYECSFQIKGKRKLYKCNIYRDTDAYIARADASPRDRLLDSIDQGCDFDHINYVIEHFNINVALIQDIVLQRAISFGSYDMLSWLQNKISLDMFSIQSKEGHSILHQLSHSQYATRFFKRAAEADWNEDMDREEKINFHDLAHDRNLFAIDKDNGDSFLQVLVNQGNTYALEQILSMKPQFTFAKNNFYWYKSSKSTLSLLQNAQNSDKVNIVHLVKDFIECVKMHDMSNKIFFRGSSKENIVDILKANELELKDSSQAKRIIRYFWDYKHGLGLERRVLALAFKCFNLFTIFIDADRSLLRARCNYSATRENNNQLVQPQYHVGERDSVLDFMQAFINGKDDRSLLCPSEMSKEDSHFYFGLYNDYFTNDFIEETKSYDHPFFVSDEWCAELETEGKEIDNASSSCGSWAWNFKLSILQKDDATSSGIVRSLDFLILRKGAKIPDPVLAIRFRRIDVLRWLHSKRFFDLDEKKDIAEISILLNSLPFMANILPRVKRKTGSMKYGLCLLMAAIAYDDLRAVEWILMETEKWDEYLRPISIIGMNIIHLASLLGRVEIQYCIYTHARVNAVVSKVDLWKKHANEPCRSLVHKGCLPFHIALSEGRTYMADLLVRLGCSVKDDMNGKSLSFYASKSEYDHVKEWISRKEAPSRLKIDVEKLVEMLRNRASMKSLKDHIVMTECMKMGSWYDNELSSTDYVDILLQCFSHNESFALWLCVWVFWGGRSFDNPPDPVGYANIFFATEDNSVTDPIPFFMLNEGNLDDSIRDEIFITRWKSKSWANDIKVLDWRLTNLCQAIAAKSFFFASKLEKTSTIIQVLGQVLLRSEREIRSQLLCGDTQGEIEKTIGILYSAVSKLRIEEGEKIDEYFDTRDSTISANLTINIDNESMWDAFSKTPSIFQFYQYHHTFDGQMYLSLCVTDYCHLLKWSLKTSDGWNREKAKQSIRLAAFMGHHDIVGLFYDNDTVGYLNLNDSEKNYAACLGYAARGLCIEMESLMKGIEGLDKTIQGIDDTIEAQERDKIVEGSLAIAAVYGYINPNLPDSSEENICHSRVLNILIKNLGYDSLRILCATELFVKDIRSDSQPWSAIKGIIDMLRSRSDSKFREVGVMLCLRRLNEECLEWCSYEAIRNGGLESSEIIALMEEWLGLMMDIPVDFQGGTLHRNEDDRLDECFSSMKQKQAGKWSQFDMITKHNCSLKQFKDAVDCGSFNLDARDRNGMFPMHVAAAYNRIDIIEWLEMHSDQNLSESLDIKGRTALQIATYANAVKSIRWIQERIAKETISTFVSSHVRRRSTQRKKRRILKSIKKFQAFFRGWKVREQTRHRILLNVEKGKRFSVIWSKCYKVLESTCMSEPDWTSISRKHMFIKVDEQLDSVNEGDFRNMDERLDLATSKAVDMVEMEYPSNEDEKVTPLQSKKMNKHPRPVFEVKRQIQMTSSVVKWLRQSDTKYREFFVRRMEQLASGDRSRILAKRLKGSKGTIYETYLEQKSGFRILWREEGDTLLIWYVAKHKNVSRLVQLIDAAENRSAREHSPASDIIELGGNVNECEEMPSLYSEDRIMLDPLDNVPLKLYEVRTEDVSDIVGERWTPQLHLTEEEKQIVTAEGTILLLGRSGTGKTVCICNRMDYDRYMSASTLSQLFISRSQRLCAYVSETVGSNDDSTFITFENLLVSLEDQVVTVEGIRRSFPRSQRMDFRRFKREVYQRDGGMDALVVWTSIRSFIKGSIETVIDSTGYLSKEEYLSTEHFGKKRCRLSMEQREDVYNIFLQYKGYMEDNGLWDDIDRVTALLRRMKETKQVEPDLFKEVCYDRIYVDEVQDYSQIECLLFFYLGGPGNLFLAGDSAQNVVEGVEFRFEDIRSVGHYIAGHDSNRRKLIPNKPMTVNINFRSHAGVLKIAASLLRLMYTAFPNSVNRLKEDQGLFTGPRPGIFYKIRATTLADLLSSTMNGTVILTHDENVRHWKRNLKYPLVYGIREAKGLEFKRVIILDYFLDLPKSMHNAWRTLMLGKIGHDYIREDYPEVEGQLKLLYTAVTRCISSLFFAETRSSTSGDSFVRWSTSVPNTGGSSGLCTVNNIQDTKKMEMTRDEWVASGIHNAESAETASDDLSIAMGLFDKAIYCFEQGQSEILARKARAHRGSIRFRSDLESILSRSDGAKEQQIKLNEVALHELEIRGAHTLESLLASNLLFEARELCVELAAFLPPYAKFALERDFKHKLKVMLD